MRQAELAGSYICTMRTLLFYPLTDMLMHNTYMHNA